MEAGVATVGDTVRDPDAVLTCSPLYCAGRLVISAIAVFEVMSPTQSDIDQIAKPREYSAVDSIRRYVIVEPASASQTVHNRQAAGQRWTVIPAMPDDLLPLPEIGVESPVAELYLGVDFQTSGSDAVPV